MKTREQIIQELEILDRGWENELPNYMHNGGLPESNLGQNVLGIILLIFILPLGILLFSFFILDDFNLVFLFFAIPILGGSISLIIHLQSVFSRKKNYTKNLNIYQTTRKKLLNDLENL